MTLLYDPDRLRAALQESGAAAVVASLPQNVLYLTRFRKAGALAVLRAEVPDRPTLLVPAASLDFVLEDPDPAVEVISCGTFYRSFSGDDLPEREATIRRLHETGRQEAPVRVATSLLEDAGGPVVVDQPPEAIPGLGDVAPGVKLSADPDLFMGLRMVKTAEELERLQAAARITEEAIAASLAAVRPGALQAEIAAAYAGAVVARGAGIRADNVSIDEGAALGNVNMPEDRVLEGSIVRYDVGAIHRGYASDIARCFSVGPPGEEHAAKYRALLRGEEAALERLRPGVRASELFQAAVGAVRLEGIPRYERTHVGHGIGIAGGYDRPLLAPGDDTVIEPGMVLCVETPYYELGRVGLQVEDMVVVTGDGFELLSHSSRDLEVVG
ncbi:MAG TPA: Xaa-Pro peptidase family protein [Actinomycetota bacterium]|nr:Xaa-Pro peptidase family protein [Actinomycetota bacterium]